MSPKTRETGLSTKEPGRENVVTRLVTMDAEAGEARSAERATADGQFTAASLDRPEPTTLVRDPQVTPLQPAAAVGDTRLVPVRPLTPFTATRSLSDLAAEGGEEPTLSAQHLASV